MDEYWRFRIGELWMQRLALSSGRLGWIFEPYAFAIGFFDILAATIVDTKCCRRRPYDDASLGCLKQQRGRLGWSIVYFNVTSQDVDDTTQIEAFASVISKCQCVVAFVSWDERKPSD